MFKIFKEKCFYISLGFIIVGALVVFFSMKQVKEAQRLVEEVEYIDSTNTYNKIYYEGEISDLRKENKELYDSLKKYKKDIDFLAQFKYKKSYETGIIRTKPTNIVSSSENVIKDENDVKEIIESKTFEYLSEPNDTFEYKLRINAEKEPNWYSLSANVKDKFTIVNKKKEDSSINHLTIESQGKGEISDVTIFNKKYKKKLKDRVSIGPSATAGYDPINKNFGVMIGIGVSYDLW